MNRIAVDGMGGDFAPYAAVDGAVQAANDFNLEVVIVGQENVIKRELQKHKVTGGKLFIQHAPEVVDMGESPVSAIKKKKNSSIAVGIDLLKQRDVNAFVSAGNTGAVVASASLRLGCLPGIKRPGIAISMPTVHGFSLIMDVGANIDPRPEHLFQYAIMSDIYARYFHKKKRPTIGLLNIGEEESKGTELLKETYKLLRDSELNFIGNIEGRDIFSGKVDCIICDGFVGNVVLKVIESIAETTIQVLKRELNKNLITRMGGLFLKVALSSWKKETDASELGGAPLLGVDGAIIISHGGATAKAIKNAIKTAGQAVDYEVNSHIVDEITKKE
ncbi:MAG: phosphate acyltransferase PlsX [Candidatus Omnitrophica bacterium]|nr:phosphate acyltransferase PlsX [Candidatus Omnitrophota bacterium]